MVRKHQWTIARGVWSLLLVGLLSLGLGGCGDRPTVRTAPPAPGASSSLGAKLAEVSPPEVIQGLRLALEDYQPQVKILSPKPNQVLKDTTVTVRLQITDLPLFKNEDYGLGPHLHLFLDNQPHQSIYDATTPIVLTDLTPGTHLLRVLASRPWDESFKNEGAYAQTVFHVFTQTADNNPDPSQPLLTYSHPQGRYGAEPILLDFYLTNVPLHLIAQERPDDEIRDWRIRCTVNGQSFLIENWQPIYLKGLKPGQNWVQLELIDDQGQPFSNPFNNTVRLIHYEPGGQDTLSRLVRGELTAMDVRGIVDPNYIPPAPEPEPSPLPSDLPPPIPSPEPEPEPLPLAEPGALPELIPTEPLPVPEQGRSPAPPPSLTLPGDDRSVLEPQPTDAPRPEPATDAPVSPEPTEGEPLPGLGNEPEPEPGADLPTATVEPSQPVPRPLQDRLQGWLNRVRRPTQIPTPTPAVPLDEPVVEPSLPPEAADRLEESAADGNPPEFDQPEFQEPEFQEPDVNPPTVRPPDGNATDVRELDGEEPDDRQESASAAPESGGDALAPISNGNPNEAIAPLASPRPLASPLRDRVQGWLNRVRPPAPDALAEPETAPTPVETQGEEPGVRDPGEAQVDGTENPNPDGTEEAIAPAI